MLLRKCGTMDGAGVHPGYCFPLDSSLTYNSPNFLNSVCNLVYCSHFTFFNMFCLSANCSAGVLIEKYVSNFAFVIYRLEERYLAAGSTVSTR